MKSFPLSNDIEGVVTPLPGKQAYPWDFYFFLFGGDFLIFLMAFALACLLRYLLGFLFPLPPFGEPEIKLLLKRGWIFAPLFGALLFKRVYDQRLPFWEETKEIVAALFWGLLGVYAFVFLKKIGSELSRLTITFTAFSYAFLLPLGRYFYKPFLFSFKRYATPVLICGAGRTGRHLAQALTQEKYLGYRVIGFLDDEAKLYGRVIEGLKVYGPIRQLSKFVRLTNVDAVFIAGGSFSPKRLAEIYAFAQRLVREIYVVPEFYGLGMLNAGLSCLLSQRLFVLRIKNNLLVPLNRYLKRCLDVTLVCLALPLLLPLMAFLALLIKLDSPGPVFFKHRRIGEGGKSFWLWKFRTMYVENGEPLSAFLQNNPQAAQEWKRFRKLRNDPRITRVGRFLRKFSLDELPQIFNILKGDMALVGPRPVTEEECRQYYREKASFYFSVKPGLTGLWQVSGRNLLPYEERVKLDVWYVLNWSLWLDIIIIVRTIGTVISQRGSF